MIQKNEKEVKVNQEPVGEETTLPPEDKPLPPVDSNEPADLVEQSKKPFDQEKNIVQMHQALKNKANKLKENELLITKLKNQIKQMQTTQTKSENERLLKIEERLGYLQDNLNTAQTTSMFQDEIFKLKQKVAGVTNQDIEQFVDKNLHFIDRPQGLAQAFVFANIDSLITNEKPAPKIVTGPPSSKIPTPKVEEDPKIAETRYEDRFQNVYRQKSSTLQAPNADYIKKNYK